MAETQPKEAGQDGRPVGLTFSDFLSKMKDPAAADLVRNIKSFIRQFEERPAGHAADPEADSAAVQAFLAQCEAAFRQHPVWRGCQPEVLDQAVEGLEKYLLSKVWRQTFGACAEDRERDERYQRLMQALGFVDLPTLMGAEVQPDENLLRMAQGELLKMDRYKAPRDKLLCLVNVKTMVENIVGLAARAGANIGGADAFFPVFLFVLIRSRLPRLASNVEYIKRFRMRPRLCGQFDFMLCQLESGAMYLDTVNYEHLSVSQEAFLRHLAAAGIPEAHLELRRMQQDAERAAAAAAAAGAAAAAAGQGDDAAADYGTEAEGAAVAAAAHARLESAPGEEAAADADDVLAGLQLAAGDGSSMPAGPADGEAIGLGSAQTSMPATPTDAAPGLFSSGGTGGRDGRASSLTPLPEDESPVMLAAPAGAAAAASYDDSRSSTRPGSAADGAGLSGRASVDATRGAAVEEPQPGAAAGAVMPRGLSFASASELASVAEQQEQRRQQRHAAAEEQAAAAAAVAAAAAAAAAEQQQYVEAALIEEMVAEGTQHVLAAEAAGQLQQRYPFMYAQAEDLSLAEVQAVLVGYKELMLRYEALSRTLQQQLGLDSGRAPAAVAAALPAAGSPSAAAAAEGSAARGQHRSKQVQQQYGFGSLIPPGQLAEAGHASLLGAADGTAGTAGAAEASSPSVPGSGRWSPGGLLQRIASRGKAARSITPPRDRDSNRAVAAAAAAAEEPAQAPSAAAAGSPTAATKAGSPSKQGPHPFFTTLFGSSGSASPKPAPRSQQQAQSEPQSSTAAPEAPADQHQSGAAASSHATPLEGACGAEPSSAVEQQQGRSSSAGPEQRYAEEPVAEVRQGAAAAAAAADDDDDDDELAAASSNTSMAAAAAAADGQVAGATEGGPARSSASLLDELFTQQGPEPRVQAEATPLPQQQQQQPGSVPATTGAAGGSLIQLDSEAAATSGSGGASPEVGLNLIQLGSSSKEEGPAVAAAAQEGEAVAGAADKVAEAPAYQGAQAAAAAMAMVDELGVQGAAAAEVAAPVQSADASSALEQSSGSTAGAAAVPSLLDT